MYVEALVESVGQLQEHRAGGRSSRF